MQSFPGHHLIRFRQKCASQVERRVLIIKIELQLRSVWGIFSDNGAAQECHSNPHHRIEKYNNINAN